MLSMGIQDIRSVIHAIRMKMEEKRDELIALDSAMGDGDLGITMVNAFTAADEEAMLSEERIPGKLLMKLGMTMAKAAPSTMGTLLATGFMRGGKAIGETENIGLPELSLFFDAFCNGIMERGKSKPGNKTIIDVIHPASIALQQAAKENKQLQAGMADAYDAAEKGWEATKHMKAQHGRAAYYQDASVGRQDAGAAVGLFLMECFSQYLSSGDR